MSLSAKMQRGRINTVTDFPVLIPSTADQQEGAATFLTELGPLQTVRTLRNSDLKNASCAMSEHEAKHFAAMMMLRQALGPKPDPLALDKAGELPRQSYELKRRKQLGTESNRTDWEHSDFARALASLAGVGSGKEAMEIYEACDQGQERLLMPAGSFRMKFHKPSVRPAWFFGGTKSDSFPLYGAPT